MADAHTQSDPAVERVQALNQLKTLLSVIPAGTDRLDIWVARPVARWLLGAGLLTLADLVRFINQHGYRWHVRIKGLGVERARQLMDWLESERENLTLFVSGDAWEAKTKREARLACQAPQTEGMPLSLAEFGAGTRVSQRFLPMWKPNGIDPQAAPTIGICRCGMFSHESHREPFWLLRSNSVVSRPSV